MKSRKQSKSKKDKPAYDENGHWVEERGRIKGAIRRCFRLSPQMKEVLQEARVELPPALKKNGQPGKRNQVRYRCAICNELFMAKNVQVDHIETVVPLHKTEAEMPFDEWLATIARGIMCRKDNLQVACSTPLKRNNGKDSCHRKKTNEENFIRKKLRSMIQLEIEKDPDQLIEGGNRAKWQIETFGTSMKGFHLRSAIIDLKKEFEQYLIDKETERLAKAQRKIEREAKREAKRIEREKKMIEKLELKEVYELAKKYPRKDK